LKLNGLRPEDVTVELLICRQFKKTKLHEFEHFEFEFTGVQEAGEDMFALDLTPGLCGKLEYYIRAYPYHPLLTHPFEMGMTVWL
jgi:starch phosphorylase